MQITRKVGLKCSSMFHIWILIVLFHIKYYDCGPIIISSNGEDSFSCVQNVSAPSIKPIPCKSIDYVFQLVSNGTLRSPLEVHTDEEVDINNHTELKIPNDYQVTIKPMTKAGNQLHATVFRCSNSNASVAIKPLQNGDNAVIAFLNISFTNCGPNVPAAVLVDGPISVSFRNCTFIHNYCSGLNVRDANLIVNHCIFMHNYANQTTDFAVDFVFGKTSLAGSLGLMFEQGSGFEVHIDSSVFKWSTSYVNPNEYVISHDTGEKIRNLSNYYAIGGGIGAVHAFNSNGNLVNITNCHFDNNTATYGGGIYWIFLHHSSDNRIYVSNSVISRNYVSQTGGGILFVGWDKAHNNSGIFTNCNISYNDAMSGGGLKVTFNNKDPHDPNKGGILKFELRKCFLNWNTAMSGSALRLMLNLPIGAIVPQLPKFSDCAFENHKPSRDSKEYPGAILSSRLGFTFEGTNTFKSNVQGSAIYSSHCSIHVKGSVQFVKNRGKDGGAIYLADISNIILYPGSTLLFERNQADFRGGALYVESTALKETTYPYNPSCFFQYSVPKVRHSEWKTQVTFSNNSASLKGAAVFINSLVGCLWNEAPPYYSYSKALRWAGKFNYFGNYLLYEGALEPIRGSEIDIATDTYDFNLSIPGKGFEISPGETFALNITAVDQLGHSIYSIPSIKEVIKHPNNSVGLDDVFALQYFVAPPNSKTKPEISLWMPSKDVYVKTASKMDNEYLDIEDSFSNFLVSKHLNMSTIKCHPGYYFDGRTCSCDPNATGIERCSGGRYIYLREGYWGGTVDGKLTIYTCPIDYCQCESEPGRPGCFYDYQNPNDLCLSGRSGTLCGRCKDGLALGLRSTHCRDCEGTGSFFAISALYVLIMSILLMWFNPNISSDIRGILFYIQVLPLLFKSNDEVGGFISIIAGLVDLGRVTGYPIDSCAVPNLGNLGTTTLNYAIPVGVLIVMLVYFLLHRCKFVEREKPFRCFLVMWILAYKYLAETCFLIVNCVYVGGRVTGYPIDSCAVPNLGNLETTTLNYAIPAGVLIVMLVYFLLHRCKFVERKKPFRCFLVTWIVVYKYLAKRCFLIVNCVYVRRKYVLFYDGTWECYQGFHLSFALVSWFVWFLLIFMPIPLIYFIVRHGEKPIKICGREVGAIPPGAIECLRQGLRRYEGNICSKCGNELNDAESLPMHRNRTNGEVNEGCFRHCKSCNSLEECCFDCLQSQQRCWNHRFADERGWWLVIDLLRRQLFVALFVFIQDWKTKQVTLSIASVFTFALHCMAWPYNNKNRLANGMEAMYLFSFVMLANIQRISDKQIRQAISVVILMLTYGFALVFFISKLVQGFTKRRSKIATNQRD